MCSLRNTHISHTLYISLAVLFFSSFFFLHFVQVRFSICFHTHIYYKNLYIEIHIAALIHYFHIQRYVRLFSAFVHVYYSAFRNFSLPVDVFVRVSGLCVSDTYTLIFRVLSLSSRRKPFILEKNCIELAHFFLWCFHS